MRGTEEHTRRLFRAVHGGGEGKKKIASRLRKACLARDFPVNVTGSHGVL
jgi:hypothetical protein